MLVGKIVAFHRIKQLDSFRLQEKLVAWRRVNNGFDWRDVRMQRRCKAGGRVVFLIAESKNLVLGEDFQPNQLLITADYAN